MSDKMLPIPFKALLNWILDESQKCGSVFSVHRPYKADGKFCRSIFGRKLETPIGPAAGPQSQLCQNIVAAYFAGARFFELKTVQKMDGDELRACVSKPCILAEDEGYNCEWSTELEVPQARDEYVKAWILLHIAAKEFSLGGQDGFQFNMSVGYDLDGIRGEKVNSFIDSMMDAEKTPIFAECKREIIDFLPRFKRFSKSDLDSISPKICNSATISTLHGCPPSQIEAIASHLIDEKGLNVFVKCNPTLLGYETARKTLDEMGWTYVTFDDSHFVGNEARNLKGDLVWDDAVPMFRRLMKKAGEKGLQFGVKITNTFPVDVCRGELPSSEMYMSGKALFPLSINLANKLAREFDGKLRIAYSGGADFFNIDKIVSAGIWPVTVSTTILKPGGYQRLSQLAEKTGFHDGESGIVDKEKTQKICDSLAGDQHYKKSAKSERRTKIDSKPPLFDCFAAPCSEACPIRQDIALYMKKAAEGKFAEALQTIVAKNPLPFMTGTICAHKCMKACNRNFYDESVNVRGIKLLAAQKGFPQVFEKRAPSSPAMAEKVAVVGGGPAGLAAAYFLANAGIEATIFEKRGSLGGTVRHVIPSFRISDEAIENDVRLCTKFGVKVELNSKIESPEILKAKGFSHVIWAVGATLQGKLELESDCEVLNAVEFMESAKSGKKVALGKNVVVVGGGNSAMDAARAAKRCGAQNVSILYRRTKAQMPADEEELSLAQEDGVNFLELLSPISQKGGILLCEKMRLSKEDSSRRAGVERTGEKAEIPCDTLIASVGEKSAGVPKGVLAAGDVLTGPATIVEAIAGARRAVDEILGEKSAEKIAQDAPDEKEIRSKRGILAERQKDCADEQARCLSCDSVCENCVEVCPNRANVSLKVKGLAKRQVIHIEYMCNECGNCKTFCHYDGAPYLDKLTLFADEASLRDSKNAGFCVVDKKSLECVVRLDGKTFKWKRGESSLDERLSKTIEAVVSDYPWLLP